MFSPKPAGSVAGRTAISPGEPSWEVWPSSVTISASPARSPGFGGATRSNATWPVTGSTPRPVALTVPLPTWHAALGVELFRHAPPLTEASASSPGGRVIVRSLGESLPLGEKLRFIPRGTVEAACVPPLWSSDTAGVTDADADDGARTTAVKPMARPVRTRLFIRSHPCW